MEYWQPYLIAIMIGLLVGIEREKSHPDQSTMGIRTFLLISMLGALAGGLQILWLSILIAAFALGLVVISYFSQTRAISRGADLGLTTEFAAGIVFCLAFVAHESPTLAAVAGPIVAVLLFSKSSLHRFIKAIQPSELQAALFLFLSGVVVINLVPDSTIDPWEIFNPKKFGYLILTLASLEFLGYVAVKIIGEKKGLLVVGFFGGLVSSTAVLFSSAKQAAKTPENWRLLVSSALAAKLASMLALLFIVFLISHTLFVSIVLIVSVGILAGGIQLFVLARANKDSESSAFKIKSPLDWKGVIRLSLALGGILALISLSKLWLGDTASTAMSFLTGLFELHGVSLANATMYKQNQLELNAAIINILLAIIASLVAKISVSWGLARGPFAKVLTLVFIVMIIIMILTAWLILS